MFSGIIHSRLQATEYTSIFVILNIFYCRGIVMEVNIIVFLALPMVTWNIISFFFFRNVSLIHHVVRIVFSCIETSFKPVLFKYKILHWSYRLTFKFKYWFFLFFLFEAMSVSSTIVRLLLNVWENSPYSRPICWIGFLTWTGIKWETLNSFQ